MQTTWIFFSCKFEAVHLLFHSDVKFIKRKNFFEFADDPSIKVALTGIGKKPTLNSLDKLETNTSDKVYKFGTCAVLEPSPGCNIPIPLMTPFMPSFTGHEDHIIKFETHDFLTGLLPLIDRGLYTSNVAVTDKNEANLIAEKGFGFVDMETYHFAKIFHNIVPVMIGTDYADEYALKNFYANIKHASEIFYHLFKKIILDLR